MLLHMLSAEGEEGEALWLLNAPKTSKKLSGALADLDEDEFYRDPSIKSWVLSDDARESLIDSLLEHGDVETCSLCEAGIACEVWDGIELTDKKEDDDDPPMPAPKRGGGGKGKPRTKPFDPWAEMEAFFTRFASDFAAASASGGAASPQAAAAMTPEQAAVLLGVTLPVTKDVLDRAFRVAALKSHPDRGGSNEAMMRVVQARAVLKQN